MGVVSLAIHKNKLSLKILDRYILSLFFPPLVVTFLIALFVLNMQFLWKYIDDIAGKGLEFSYLIELIFYHSLSMFPLSLILAIIIAGVMTMGNLAERYELPAIKSSGASLFRAMRPLIIACGAMAVMSYLFVDSVIPVAMLKFRARLHDIRKQKPTLNLQPGQFNYDFQNFVIYVREKGADDKSISGVKIYDHSTHRGNTSITAADSGLMYFTQDQRYMMLQLNNGERTEDLQTEGQASSAYLPRMRMQYKEYVSSFDLRQFEMSKTDENLFKNAYMLLSTRQLYRGLDSMQNRIGRVGRSYRTSTDAVYFYPKKLVIGTPEKTKDSLRRFVPPAPGKTLEPFSLAQFSKDERVQISNQAVISATGMLSYAEQLVKEERDNITDYVRFSNELHKKFSIPLACLIFLFVSAPMGALVRKGGFGWPILIAIIYFTVYFVISMAGEKMAQNLVISSALGAWLPCIVLFPVGIWLTYGAMMEYQFSEMGLAKFKVFATILGAIVGAPLAVFWAFFMTNDKKSDK